MSAPAPDRLAALEQRVAELEAAQADELSPGVFSINSRGELVETIGQLHANGIVLPRGHVIGKSLFGPGSSSLNELAWEDPEEGGVKVGNIAAFNWDAKVPAVGALRELQINVTAPAGEGGNTYTTGLLLIQSREASAAGELFAYAGSREAEPLAGAEAMILNSLGESDFAQFVGNLVSNRLQIQVGHTQIAHPGGVVGFDMALHRAWKHEHLFFAIGLRAFASLEGVFTAQYGPYSSSTGLETLGSGGADISSSKAQTMEVIWISVGR